MSRMAFLMKLDSMSCSNLTHVHTCSQPNHQNRCWMLNDIRCTILSMRIVSAGLQNEQQSNILWGYWWGNQIRITHYLVFNEIRKEVKKIQLIVLVCHLQSMRWASEMYKSCARFPLWTVSKWLWWCTRYRLLCTINSRRLYKSIVHRWIEILCPYCGPYR